MIKFIFQVLLVVVLGALQLNPQLDKHIIPVYGNVSLGYYYVNVYIGTPPQKQSVILTTASGVFAVPCSQCKSCGKHLQNPLDEAESSTNKIITCDSSNQLCRDSCSLKGPHPCTFSISYGEGSTISGTLLEDKVQFEQNSQGEAATITFGCTTKQTNLFARQKASGVLGLSPKSNSRLVQLFYENHKNYTGQKLIFSLNIFENGGEMVVGNRREELFIGKPSAKTTFDSKNNLYALNKVGKMKMGNTILNEGQYLGNYGIFIEIGSTYTYFPAQQYKIAINQIQKSCNLSAKCEPIENGIEKCYKIFPAQKQSLTSILLSHFESVDIQINGTVVKWAPNMYLRPSNQSNVVCLGFQSLDRFLLGCNWMINRNIVFDLQQQTVQIFSQIEPSQQLQILVEQSSYKQPREMYTLDDNDGPLKLVLIIIIGLILIVGIGVYIFKRHQSLKRQSIAITEKEISIKQDDTKSSSDIKQKVEIIENSIEE